MDRKVKSSKYLKDQPVSVHSYASVDKSDSPRLHASPTSILRKYPHSLRHDQKHQTKIKRNSSPVTMVVKGGSIEYVEKTDRDVKSWCLGNRDEKENLSQESVMTPSRSSDIICKKFDSVTNIHNPIDQEKSECGVSGASEKYINGESSVLKLREDSVNVNINDCNSVHNFVSTPEKVNSPEKGVVLSRSRVDDDDFTSSELEKSKQSNDRLKIGSFKKLSVINNSLRDYENVDKKFGYNSIDKLSELNNRITSPVHKSTPNLLPSEVFGIRSSVSHSEHITDRLSRIEYVHSKETLQIDFKKDGNRVLRNQQVPLKGSDSLPQLNQRYKFIHSFLPKLNRAISESNDKPNFSKGYMKSDTQINSNARFGAANRSDSYQLLSNSGDLDPVPRIVTSQSDDESESFSLVENRSNVVIRSQDEKLDVKNRWSYRRPAEIMPSLKNLVTRRHRRGVTVGKKGNDGIPPSVSVPLVTTPPKSTSGSFCSLNSPVIRNIDSDDESLTPKKSDTMYSLMNFTRTSSLLQIEPMKPMNRLRVPPNRYPGSASRICSRCSSLLSMASSSRYSINTTGSGFIPCSPTSEKAIEPNMLCKLCLLEVPLSQSMAISECGCVFCRDCMRLYVEFEIQKAAYDISCPDAQCNKQGVVTINEVEQLVSVQMMERYMRFRLNHEVDLDKNRTWCPRAGCETICDVCPREKCAPMSVHCPTCDSDFCSNCKNPWHLELTCEENSKKLAKEGHSDFMEAGIPFDSDLIKCCPMCSVPIEKDEGCAQMMCKKCKHVFCWYCLASLDDDFLLRHYDKGPCKNKLGHSRASVIWHRTQVIGIFAGFGILLLVASPLLLVAAPCIVCCKCRVCSGTKLDSDEDLPDDSGA